MIFLDNNNSTTVIKVSKAFYETFLFFISCLEPIVQKQVKILTKPKTKLSKINEKH